MTTKRNNLKAPAPLGLVAKSCLGGFFFLWIGCSGPDLGAIAPEAVATRGEAVATLGVRQLQHYMRQLQQ